MTSVLLAPLPHPIVLRSLARRPGTATQGCVALGKVWSLWHSGFLPVK